MKDTSYDGKLCALLLLRSWRTIIFGTILGALIVGIPYTLSKTVVGNFTYRSDVTLHVEFGEDTAGNAYDYINYYTWGQWIDGDEYNEKLISEYNLGISPEELKNYLDAEVPADQRVVVFVVATHDKALTDKIATAISDSIVEYVTGIKEVEQAQIISRSPAVKYFVFKNIPQSFVFGAIVGFFVTGLGVWLLILLDDSVYIPELFERKTGLIVVDKPQGTVVEIAKKIPDMSEATEKITLNIICGAHNGKIVDYVLHECEKKKITVEGVVLSKKDEKLIKKYYAAGKIPGLFLKEE